MIKDKIIVNVVFFGIVENFFDLEEMIFKLFVKCLVILWEINYVVWFFINFNFDYIIG